MIRTVQPEVLSIPLVVSPLLWHDTGAVVCTELVRAGA